MRNRSTILPLVLLLAVAGCAADAGPLGQVAVAIVGTDANNASYTLPPGTALQLAGGNFLDDFVLDGNTSTVSISVPARTYSTVKLLDATGSQPASWSLTRTNPDGSVQTVAATLLALPLSIDVQKDQTTDLVLTFQVVDGAKVTFAHGTVTVSVGVNETTSLNGTASLQAPSLTIASVTEDPTIPGDLATAFATVSAGQTIGMNMGGAVDGVTWAQTASDEACASLLASTLLPSTGSQALYNMVLESVTDPESFCVTTVTTDAIEISFSRSGAGPDSTFYNDCTDASPCTFFTNFSIALPAAVFDGQSIDLAALANESGSVSVSVSSGVYGAGVLWFQASSSGTATFSYTPQ